MKGRAPTRMSNLVAPRLESIFYFSSLALWRKEISLPFMLLLRSEKVVKKPLLMLSPHAWPSNVLCYHAFSLLS